MNRAVTWLLVLVLFPALAWARPAPPVDSDRIVDSDHLVRGGALTSAKAEVDTVYIYGGPGSLAGKFESAGWPDRQGWSGLDETVTGEVWQQDTFNAANLDAAQPDNHAWWCGALFPACDETDPSQGYGNDWRARLAWSAAAPDPLVSTSVTVTAVLNFDLEAGYDFVSLTVRRPDGTFTEVISFSGFGEGISVNETFAVTPEDYTGETADLISLAWRVRSDSAWSDEDCQAASTGAAQIDNIEVQFAGVPVGPLETCEPGAPSTWLPEIVPGVGDFAQVWPALQDLDRCFDNKTPVVAFVDDGLVVPGTGGYLCQTHCYGPGGFIVNPEGGLGGPTRDIHNYLVSPPLAVPVLAPLGVDIAFDVFVHNLVGMTGIFYLWHVSSTDDPVGENGWSAWRSRSAFYEGGPFWKRHTETVGDLLVPGATFMRVRLGVIESNVCGQENTDGTPAPYFDNVAVRAYPAAAGPLLTALPQHLAQDGFPSVGTLAVADLAEHSVRFDMARDLNDRNFESTAIDPGDSIAVRVELPSGEGALTDPPRLFYRLQGNPLYDPHRLGDWPAAGSVAGISDEAAHEPKWTFDLPDTGFIFPGDQLHYYICATAENAGWPVTSLLPADTTGFSNFPDGTSGLFLTYDERFTVRGLPSVRLEDEALSQPDVLLVDEFGNEDHLSAWRLALAQLGYVEGLDYDTFSSVAAKVFRTGLGTRATLAQITGYTTLLVDGGNTPFGVLDGSYRQGIHNPRGDLALLQSWLDLGPRNLLVMGDRIATGLAQDSEGEAFLRDVMGIQMEAGPLADNLDGQNEATLLPVSGNPVLPAGEIFGVAGCSLEMPVNDLETLLVGTGTRLAEWADPSGAAGAYAYSAGTLNLPAETAARVVSLPLTLLRIVPPVPGQEGPAATRYRLLSSLLTYFGLAGSGQASAVPDAARLTVDCWPNPFNPATTLAYDMPRSGRLAVRIFDMSGRLVRTLWAGTVGPGPGQVIWNGRDSGGRQASSGVYFARIEALGQVRHLKLALVK